MQSRLSAAGFSAVLSLHEDKAHLNSKRRRIEENHEVREPTVAKIHLCGVCVDSIIYARKCLLAMHALGFEVLNSTVDIIRHEIGTCT